MPNPARITLFGRDLPERTRRPCYADPWSEIAPIVNIGLVS